MALKFKPKPQATAETSTKLPTGVETSTSEKVKLPDGKSPWEESMSPKPWCELEVRAGYTKNLGDYSSARVDVALRVPCQHDEIDSVATFAEDWVNDRLNKMIEGL